MGPNSEHTVRLASERSDRDTRALFTSIREEEEEEEWEEEWEEEEDRMKSMRSNPPAAEYMTKRRTAVTYAANRDSTKASKATPLRRRRRAAMWEEEEEEEEVGAFLGEGKAPQSSKRMQMYVCTPKRLRLLSFRVTRLFLALFVAHLLAALSVAGPPLAISQLSLPCCF